jgi:MerR family transcriptional regulator, heat shock protein HspR
MTTEPETYSLQEAARSLGVSAADIESYIEEGLLELRRGPAGEAFLSRAEMRRLWSIVTLSRDLGINLPGVAAVLQLREQVERARHDLTTLVEIMERELGPNCWDRLWPEGRPRPSANVSVEGITDLPDTGAPPENGEPGPVQQG